MKKLLACLALACSLACSFYACEKSCVAEGADCGDDLIDSAATLNEDQCTALKSWADLASGISFGLYDCDVEWK